MTIKGIFEQKCTHPQTIQDADEFVSSSEKIKWMGAVRMIVQTVDKTVTVKH